MWAFRGGVVLVVAAAVLAGCGGSDHTKKRRDAVNAYFDRVDRAQARLLASSGEIDAAFAKFKLTGNSATELRELAFARARVDTALRRVRLVEPPQETRRLHADLVRLLTLERTAAAELLWIARYEPKFETAVAPVASAGKQLAAGIRAAVKSQPAPATPSTQEKLGAAVFVQGGCASCHALSAVGSTAAKGPNLDPLQLTADEIAAVVRTGAAGMPSFKKRLKPEYVDAVAAFVASAERTQASSNAVLDAYGAAFRRYGRMLEGILADLDSLSAPSVLRATLLAERRTLRRAAALSGSVADALHRRDLDAANKSIAALFNTSATADQESTRKAAAAAVRAYNVRLRDIAKLAARITRERQRLVSTIG